MNLCGLVLAALGFRLFQTAPFHLPLELPRSLQNQMIVVAHEANGMNLPLGLLARLSASDTKWKRRDFTQSLHGPNLAGLPPKTTVFEKRSGLRTTYPSSSAPD